MRHIDGIVKAARAAKIPTAAAMGGVEESGILLTLCAAPQAQGKEAAGIVAEVINGSKPSSIPVKESGKVEMIVNVREAKALGLNVPFDLLMSATKVIK
jgi:putative ABC transport system substrate-binding protein